MWSEVLDFNMKGAYSYIQECHSERTEELGQGLQQAANTLLSRISRSERGKKGKEEE